MGEFKFIDHTADIAVEITGNSLIDLFETAFYTLKEIVIEENDSKISNEVAIELHAERYGELLINFLSELNYFTQVKKFIIKSISEIRIDDRVLSCNILYEVFDPAKHELKEEIKAVTYHQLNLQEVDNHYIATIVFDI